jgi:hypothetical protein
VCYALKMLIRLPAGAQQRTPTLSQRIGYAASRIPSHRSAFFASKSAELANDARMFSVMDEVDVGLPTDEPDGRDVPIAANSLRRSIRPHRCP